jgi:hypothetical protein
MPYDIDAQLYHKNSSTFIVTNILLILGFSKPLFGWPTSGWQVAAAGGWLLTFHCRFSQPAAALASSSTGGKLMRPLAFHHEFMML